MIGISHQETMEQIRTNTPPIEVNQRWVIRHSDGKLLRKLRIIAPHPDGSLFIFQDEPCGPDGLIKRDFTRLGITPEYNLRRIFTLAED